MSNPFVSGFLDVFRVPSRRTVTGWADDVRMLPSKGAAEPGKYRSTRTPYMREPMDCMSITSPVQEVAIMAGAQLGKSESLNNLVGYVIDEAPGPMLLVQPTVDNAKRYSKQRITPMISETPSLAAKVMENKSRDSGNTMLEKEFPGGILILGGANSAAGLRSMPIRFLLADEISNWPLDVDGEGDPLKLAEARTNTFGRKRKIMKTSTPAVKELCRIEKEMLKTDWRKYFVPCPHCDHMHTLEWKNFVIPKTDDGPVPARAYMVCPECGGIIEERHKTDMLNGGEWRPTLVDNVSETRRGYHISGLYSPVGWKSWAEVAKEWVEAQGDPSALQAFVNNVLAETWEENYSTKIDADSLSSRAESYEQREAPEGVLVITAGVDVQVNRIEVQKIGWGEGEEAWVLSYDIIYGDPSRFEIWSQVLDLINTPTPHANGVKMVPYATIVDSGDGNMTNEVYAFTRENRDRHIIAGKGMAGSRPPLGTPSKQDINIRGQKIKNGAVLYGVGVDSIKSTLYSRLKREDAEGAGVIHFPLGMPEEYYKQLTAEKQAVKMVNGFPKRYWVKKDGDRNEALDTFVYCYAALHYCYTRHNRATFWRQMAAKLSNAADDTVKLSKPRRDAVPDDPQPEMPVVGKSGGRISLSGFRRG